MVLGVLRETMASSPGVEGSSSSSSTVVGIEVDVYSAGSFSTKLWVLQRVLTWISQENVPHVTIIAYNVWLDIPHI